MKSRALPLLVLTFTHAWAGPLPTPDADDGGILLPPGFRAVVFADNLVANLSSSGRSETLRFLAVAPSGDVYGKTKSGPILALRDTDGDGRADIIKEFGDGGGTGLMFHDGWLYHSTDKDVYRYKYTPGELVPGSTPERIVRDLPNQRQHESKTFFFDDSGHLFVETGSPSNSFGGEKDRRLGATGSDATDFLTIHGGFWRFDPAKPDQTQADGYHYSTGHRHVVGVAWNPVSHAAYFVMHGRDNLNTVAPQFYSLADSAELPAEELHKLVDGLNVGWPYTYYDPMQKARMIAPEYGGDGHKRATPGQYPDPLIAIAAHWAPLQMVYYAGSQFPAHYHGGMFIAFHGSWNRAPLQQQGYNVCFIPFDKQGEPTGEFEVFADNFKGKTILKTARDARYRPGGLAVGPDGSLYIGDTEKGRIWRVFYTGEVTPGARVTLDAPADVQPTPTITTTASTSRGAKLYASTCAACHMADGSGVPSLQPPLRGSPIVRGDPVLLLGVMLKGPNAVLPKDRPKFSNMMPPFRDLLTDDQAVDLANYLRATFGGNTSPVTPQDAANARK